MPSSASFDHVEPMDAAQRALMDILSSVRRPDGYCCTLVDFTRAEEFRRQRVERTGVPITLIDMTLRSLALTAGQNPAMRSLVEGYSVHRSESIDIGCSVATDTPLAPIVVFRAADKLSLEEIHLQRVQMTREAIIEQEKRLAELGKITKWMPDGLRRRLIARFANDPKNRKQHSGVFALSAIELDDMEWMCPSHIAGSLLVSMGGIKPRPMVVNGIVEPRLCALVTFMIDQRVIHPMRAMRVFRRFRRLLENPEKLG
jgi:pyruvate/2-oxoglutarate dehydrogenase complex dihydrolipoamide acyltransferase (E2) component